jgi:hypothetical protein
MAKKRSPKKEATSYKDATEQLPSLRDRIQALLNELADAELNILIYEIENPKERRSMEKLGRIASARLKRTEAIKVLVDMLMDYNIERHPRLETHYLTDKYHLREYFYDYCM